MKKIRGHLTFLLILLIGVLCSGCSSHSTMKANKDGSGTFSCKYSIDKKIYTSSTYVTIKNSKDLVTQLQKKLPKGTNVKFTLDTTSSKTYDYITASFTYSSLEELDKKASLLLDSQEESANTPSIDEKEINKYIDSIDEDKILSDSLSSYLKDKNIVIDETSASYKLMFTELKTIFNKIDTELENDLETGLENSLETEGNITEDTLLSNYEEDDNDEDYNIDDILASLEDDDTSQLTSKIINNKTKNALLINPDSIIALDTYISYVITDYATSKINIDKMMKELVDKSIDLNKKIYKEVFTQLKIEDTFKDISTLTEEQTKAIFTDEYKTNISKIYKASSEKHLEEFIADYTGNILTTLNGNQLTDAIVNKYTIEYAGKNRTYTLEELMYNIDDEGYVSLTNLKKGAATQLDETPKTDDTSNFILHILLAGFMLASVLIVALKIKW